MNMFLVPTTLTKEEIKAYGATILAMNRLNVEGYFDGTVFSRLKHSDRAAAAALIAEVGRIFGEKATLVAKWCERLGCSEDEFARTAV